MRHAAKAIAPAVLTVVAVVVQWAITGEIDRAEIATALTGLSAAVVTYFVRNDPSPI